jgi:hypothetical protein
MDKILYSLTTPLIGFIGFLESLKLRLSLVNHVVQNAILYNILCIYRTKMR